MLKRIFLALVALIVIFAIVVALQPASYRIVRSTSVAAAPSAVYPLVNDFHAWAAWSPWAKLDPGMKITYEGPAAGTGAIYKWAGNKEVGEGQMTLLESKPNELVRIKLHFIKPFSDTCTTEFVFKPEGDKTVVTWAMYGKNGFLGKAMSLFMDCDKMCGPQFEKGLASLGEVAASSQMTAK